MAAQDVKITHQCPLCSKLRMVRPADYKVNLELTEINLPNGEKLSVPYDICDWCINRIIKKYFKPKKESINKIIEAMNHGESLPENKSLEELL